MRLHSVAVVVIGRLLRLHSVAIVVIGRLIRLHSVAIVLIGALIRLHRLWPLIIRMTSLLPLLIKYSSYTCGVPSPIVPAPQLIRELAHNGLVLRDDTRADGNCGIHGFYLSLADFADRSQAMKNSNAWKNCTKLRRDTDKVIQHLRGAAVKWMKANGDRVVWNGMPFRVLACQMSHVAELRPKASATGPGGAETPSGHFRG